MTFPDYLIDGYKQAQQSRLVQGETTPEAMAEFARILNQVGSGGDVPTYATVQALFRANRRGYIACIRGTANEPTVLWTDPRTIANWFELSRRVYIKSDRNATYVVRLVPTHNAKGAAPPLTPDRHASRPNRHRAPKDDIQLDFPTIEGDEVRV